MAKPEKDVNSRAQSLIDDNLKRVYADVENEALPDRFLDLLSQLKEQETKKGDPS
jgi:hypothetical protein